MVGFKAFGGVGEAANDDAQAEAVEDLGTEPTFFGIEGANEGKAGAIGGGEGAAAEGVDALGDGVEDGVGDGVGQQVDFVNVEQVLVGMAEDAALEGHAVVRRAALIEAADDVFEASVEGELNQADGVGKGEGLALAVFPSAVGADGVEAATFDIFGQAAVRAGRTIDERQQVGQAADGGGFAGATRADEEHAADGGIDEGEQEGQLHLALGDEGEEREGMWLGQAARLGGGNAQEALGRGLLDELFQ
jgi:hypothetical protein